MPNIINNLLPNLYHGLDIVSRELQGFLPAVALDSKDERAALNQPIYVPITGAPVTGDVTPAVTPPDTGDQTINSITMMIQKSKFAAFRWNGEQQLGLRNAGTYEGILTDQFAQAFRTLSNWVETDCAAAAYQGASRAYGNPGTAPFGVAGDLSDASNVRKILDDNGAPQSDLQLVLGSAAVNNLRGKQSLLLKANENGSNDFRERGRLSDIPLVGFDLHNSNAVQAVATGTGSGYVTSGTTAAGVNQITLATGTGTILPGDVIQLPGDPNKYVVTVGLSAPGTITIGAPGLLKAAASGAAVTVNSTPFTPNVAFHRSALQLITRPPAIPTGPDGTTMDMALDNMLITDPFSGITFDVSIYPQFRQMLIYVTLAWGITCIKPNNVAILQG